MLKNLLSVFLLVHIAFGTPLTTTPATAPQPSLEQFLASLPSDKIKTLVTKHLETDPGFVSAIKYLKSPEFVEMREKMHNAPKWKAVKEQFTKFGINLESLVDRMDHCLNATDVEKIPQNEAPANLTDFVTELKANIMVPLMKSANDMMKNAGGEDGMKKFLEQIGSADNKKLLEEALGEAEVKTFLKKLKELGIPVEELLNFIYVLVGWEPQKFEF